MKKSIFILLLLSNFHFVAQDLISLFNEKTFELKHFIRDGVVEELDLKHPSGDYSFPNPSLNFIFNGTSNLLEAGIGGYCNGTQVEYTVENSYLNIIKRLGITLVQCDVIEEETIFIPLAGIEYKPKTPIKVNYSFSDNNTSLTLWAEENYKLVYEEKVLSTNNNLLENTLDIYPNPVYNFINIKINSNTFKISEVIISDLKGKILIKETANVKKIDISNLDFGIYLVKIKSNKGILVTKKIIKTSKIF